MCHCSTYEICYRFRHVPNPRTFHERYIFGTTTIESQALPMWSFDGVFQYLKSDIFEPLEVVEYFKLIAKTLFLILMSSRRRISEITNLSTNSFYDSFLKRLKLEWLEGFKPKHYTANFRPDCPSIELKMSNGELDPLCPTRALTIYLSRMYQ